MLRERFPLFAAFCLMLLVCPDSAFAQRDEPRLTHGPMLGRPAADSVAVWVRTSDPAKVEIRYGIVQGDPIGDRHLQSSVTLKTMISDDCTGFVTLSGLQPQSTYHYQAYLRGAPHGRRGQFHTLPASQPTEWNPEGKFNFRFQIGSCANQNPDNGIGHYSPTYEHLVNEWQDRIDFHIMNGDWLYEEARDFPPEAWRLIQGIEQLPPVVRDMPSIVGVWENYKHYMARNADLETWHRNVPSIFTFDDHELVNDIWGAGTAGRRDRRAVFRDVGTQAWHDYLGWANPPLPPGDGVNAPLHHGRGKLLSGSDILVDQEADFTKLPLDRMTNLHVHWGTVAAGVNDMTFDGPDAPDAQQASPNAAVYDIVDVIDPHKLKLSAPASTDEQVSYSIGSENYTRFTVSNCEFYVLDTRGNRDMHDVRDRGRADLSMLGQRQLNWLIDGMQSSDAEFMFVISSVPLMIPHSGAGGFEMDAENKEEAWTGFYAERERLINVWDDLNKPVFVMTGDLHNSFAIRITDTVWEFCCGPHNSVNHVPELDESNRPATGHFQFGPRPCDIRWSSYVLADVPRAERMAPHFCVVQVNNTFNSPLEVGDSRPVAFPHPQVVFQYYDGWTGELAYAEAISLPRTDP